MDQPHIPKSALQLATCLARLRETRRVRQAASRARPIPRKSLSSAQRAEVLKKTDHRCHICGGRVDKQWQADHVLSHSDGGLHSAANYLPAHKLCNHYRWDYTAEEFQWVLKIGVWARTKMESGSGLGDEMVRKFFDHETRRHARRKR